MPGTGSGYSSTIRRGSTASELAGAPLRDSIPANIEAVSLLGKAAIAIWCQIDARLRTEHDAWHSGEHLPERLGIPGFLRGRRCRAADAAARWPYFIFYELRDAAVMTSSAYLERLNNPTPWSRKLFASCRLSRTLCRVVQSRGRGVGGQVLTVQNPAQVQVDELASRSGITGVHLLERDSSIERPRTHEESLRHGGGDDSVGRVLIVEGHDLTGVSLSGERYLLAHLLTANEDLPVQ